jgi:uncharacterized protein YjbI with pentapeptide repeats
VANPEHVDVARSGAAAIAAWREDHPREPLDLCQADLSGCDLRGAALLTARLSGADLSEALLAGADIRSCTFTAADLRAAELAEASASGARLGGADLRAAVMNGIDLRGAELPEADLSDALLRGADLRAAVLDGAHLHRTDLREADLRRCRLRGARFVEVLLSSALLGEADLIDAVLTRTAVDSADFDRALCGGTGWLELDLSEARGLESLQHAGPSTVGLDTVYRSRGRIPVAFLRGCGVAENFIANLESLTRRSVTYYSCAVCYSPQDEAFAGKLHDLLQGRGIRCWLDEQSTDEDHQTARPTLRRRAGKVVLCASQHMLRSPAARQVIAEVLADEDRLTREQGVSVEVLVPIDLDGALDTADCEAMQSDVLRRRIAAEFARSAREPDHFTQQLERLVRVLTASPGATDQLTLADQALVQLRLVSGRAEGLL